MNKLLLLFSSAVIVFTACTNTADVDIDNSFQKKRVERETPDFFSEKVTMPVGSYYYPEHWDSTQWERDLKNMAELGFDFTHFGEFAWARMEPTEGNFQFDWLDKSVELANKYGLKVVLCTPTPCPPAWLTNKHPEVLCVNEEGKTIGHGSRLQANGMNETYQFYAKRIITKLAERYGNDERIWGWQLDNEPHFAPLYDYSETAQRHFKDWLKNKYNNNIDELNKAWGTAFWSQTYNNFEQIKIPNSKEGAGGSPHSFVDYKRFNAEELSASLRYQANILKEKVASNQWITTNYAYYKFLPSVDIFGCREDLDHAGHTMYLLSTYLNYPEGELAHRLGSGMELSFSNELATSVNGYTGIMELQPGQINWGAYNSRPLPGAVRMWIWHAYGLGDKYVCNYRFRQPTYGGEQFHEGVMETDGVTVSHGGKEYVQALKEIKALDKYKDEVIEEPEDWKSRKTAFLWKMENMWDIQQTPHNTSWDPWQHYYTYYEDLKTLGSEVTFLLEEDKFDVEKYKYLVVPSYRRVDDKLIEKLNKYAEEGGNIIISCQAGLKDNNGHLWEKMLQEPIWNLIGAKVDYYDQLPPSGNGLVKFNEEEFEWSMWGDVLIPFKGTEVWGIYQNQFYKGSPVITHRKVGKGTITYIGTWSKDGELERKVLRKVYSETGAQILDLPRYAFTEWRDGFWVTVNYTSETINAPCGKDANIIYGKSTVKPGDICVWK